jgi:transcriptional regulator with XRE-family HTH domain
VDSVATRAAGGVKRRLPHVSRCFVADLAAREARDRRRADFTDLAGRIAKFGGSSGKIPIMYWERLGDEVRLRRKQLKLTQPEVAERGGLSVATVRAVETNRSGRLSRRLRRALERAIEWEEGSVDAVLEGRAPRVIGTAAVKNVPPAPPVGREAAERFAMAERLIKIRRAFADHRDHMTEAAQQAMDEEFTAAAREIEEALIWMLPWLGDKERAAAIRILAELRGD